MADLLKPRSNKKYINRKVELSIVFTVDIFPGEASQEEITTQVKTLLLGSTIVKKIETIEFTYHVTEVPNE